MGVTTKGGRGRVSRARASIRRFNQRKQARAARQQGQSTILQRAAERTFGNR